MAKRGPKHSGQNAKPSKAARARSKKYSTDETEKVAYRTMKAGRGVANLNMSRKMRIKARRGAKAAARKGFQDRKKLGLNTTDLSGFMMPGMTKKQVEAMLYGSKANQKRSKYDAET